MRAWYVMCFEEKNNGRSKRAYTHGYFMNEFICYKMRDPSFAVMLPCLQECSCFLGCRDLIWLVGIHISQTKMAKLFQTVSLIFQTESLELLTSATKLFNWFKNNYLKANSGKSHILLYGSITTSSNVKLLWITIDSVLKFENYMTKLCLKFSKKPNTLSYIKFHVNRKSQTINESIYRITIQLLSLDMDALF